MPQESDSKVRAKATARVFEYSAEKTPGEDEPDRVIELGERELTPEEEETVKSHIKENDNGPDI